MQTQVPKQIYILVFAFIFMGFDFHLKYTKEIVAVLIIIVAAIALWQTFAPTKCGDYTCFQAYMMKCERATFANDDESALWGYEVIGTGNKGCDVAVTLLSAKEGDLSLRDYEGTDMVCTNKVGESGYPEKNLGACHGELKEGLQAVVIEKLYKYIVVNLGEIRQEVLY